MGHWWDRWTPQGCSFTPLGDKIGIYRARFILGRRDYSAELEEPCETMFDGLMHCCNVLMVPEVTNSAQQLKWWGRLLLVCSDWLMCMYIHIYPQCLDLNKYAFLIILSKSFRSFNNGLGAGIACITHIDDLESYVYVYIYTSLYIHVYVYIHTHVCIRIYICI